MELTQKGSEDPDLALPRPTDRCRGLEGEGMPGTEDGPGSVWHGVVQGVVLRRITIGEAVEGDGRLSSGVAPSRATAPRGCDMAEARSADTPRLPR